MVNPDIIELLYAEHINGGLSCAKLDAKYRHAHGWTAEHFREAGLRPRSIAEQNKMRADKGENGGGTDAMRTFKSPRKEPVRLSHDRLRVRLVKRKDKFYVRQVDDQGRPMGYGVPATPFEIAMGLELAMLLKRMEMA
jgi:hypothetical protein